MYTFLFVFAFFVVPSKACPNGCYFHNYIICKRSTYSLFLFIFLSVSPSPSYLEIIGCEKENCVLMTNKTNSYTCSISEVRPVVGLEWHISDENKITIISKEETSSEFEGLFNVKSEITLETTTEARCGDTVRVTCKATGSATRLFTSSTEIYMKGI